MKKDYGLFELDECTAKGNNWQILNHFVDKASPFYSESAAIGLRILTKETNLDKHYHNIGKEIFIIKEGWMEIAIFAKKDTKKIKENILIFDTDFLVIIPRVIHKIISFKPETEVFIILTPNIPNDKVIVE